MLWGWFLIVVFFCEFVNLLFVFLKWVVYFLRDILKLVKVLVFVVVGVILKKKLDFCICWKVLRLIFCRWIIWFLIVFLFGLVWELNFLYICFGVINVLGCFKMVFWIFLVFMIFLVFILLIVVFYMIVWKEGNRIMIFIICK